MRRSRYPQLMVVEIVHHNDTINSIQLGVAFNALESQKLYQIYRNYEYWYLRGCFKDIKLERTKIDHTLTMLHLDYLKRKKK